MKTVKQKQRFWSIGTAWLLFLSLFLAPLASASWLFESGDRVEISDNAVLSFPAGVWTLEGWVKTAGASTSNRTILNWNSGNKPSFSISYRGSGIWPGNSLTVTYWGSSSGSSSSTYGCTPGDATDWVHIVVCRDAAADLQAYVYENGTETSAANVVNLTWHGTCNSDASLYFGSLTAFDGRLAEWAFYNDRLMDATERASRRTGTKPDDMTGELLPDWHLRMYDDWDCDIGGLTVTNSGASLDATYHPVDRGDPSPLAVTNLWPIDGNEVNYRTTILWTPTPADTTLTQTYTVYLDKGAKAVTNPTTVIGGPGLTSLSCDSGVLDENSTYTLRIDATSVGGTTTGTEIEFTTFDFPAHTYIVSPLGDGTKDGLTAANAMAYSSVGTTESDAAIILINPDATIFYEYESNNSAVHTVWADRAYYSQTVTEYGITRTFQDYRPIKRFINGNYCTKHPTWIVDYTPAMARRGNGTIMNGMMINVSNITNQGLDGRFNSEYGVYNEAANRGDELPLLVPGVSPRIVWNCYGIPDNTGPLQATYPRVSMWDISILTVLDELPANNNTWFRPSSWYFAENAVQHQWSDVQTDRLPQVAINYTTKPLLSATSTPRTVLWDYTGEWASIEAMVNRTHSDLTWTWGGTFTHAWNAENHYQGYLVRDYANATLALMDSSLGAVTGNKKRTLIGCIQTGIDIGGVYYLGYNNRGMWTGDGALNHGRYWPVLFAGILLDDATMKNIGFSTSQHLDRDWDIPERWVFAENSQLLRLSSAPNFLGTGRTFFVTPPWKVRADGLLDSTGTCSIVQGSQTVTAAAGETWTTAYNGKKFIPVTVVGTDVYALDSVRAYSTTGRAYTILSVDSPTTLTLSTPYEGTSVTDVAFRISNYMFLGQQYSQAKNLDWKEFYPAEDWDGKCWWFQKPHQPVHFETPLQFFHMSGAAYSSGADGDDYQRIFTASQLNAMLAAMIMHQYGGYPAITAWNSPQTWEYYDWCKNNLGGTGQPSWGNYNDGVASSRLATFWTYPPTYDWDDPTPPTVTKAHTPVPSSSATGVLLSQVLSWSSGAYATKHNVYFGTESGNLSLVSEEQTTNTFQPTLTYGTTYYWRIDELDEGVQEITGDEWSFTTRAAPATGRWIGIKKD